MPWFVGFRCRHNRLLSIKDPLNPTYYYYYDAFHQEHGMGRRHMD
jgi:hypothetical protein